MAKQVKLKPKKIKGRIATLKAMPYEGHMVYVRLIGTDIVEWMLVFNGEIYSNYMVFTLPPGRKELTKIQVDAAVKMLWAGAEATIDMLMGKTLDKEAETIAKTVVNSHAN